MLVGYFIELDTVCRKAGTRKPAGSLELSGCVGGVTVGRC
jgi:hypothetical protein